MRLWICAALLCGSALALPAAAQDMRRTLGEEIHMQHDRARELQAIGQGDERMAQDLNNQAQALEAHAARLDDRARQFRAMANAQMFNPDQARALNKFADELDKYSHSDRANVGFRRRVANDMSNSAKGAYDAAREHEDHANRMQAFLDRMGDRDHDHDRDHDRDRDRDRDGDRNRDQQRPPPPQPQPTNPWQ